MERLGLALEYATGEFWLKTHPNGGGVIFLRTLQVSTTIFGIGVWVQNVCDPNRTLWPSWVELWASVGADLPWLGAIAAATYAAFYSRFAAQWSYLAAMYNQIKQTEFAALAEAEELKAGSRAERVLAEWKAAFIDDADVLHLATQKSFASIVIIWARDELVGKSFAAGTYQAAEARRFELIVQRAKGAFEKSRERAWSTPPPPPLPGEPPALPTK